MVTDLSVQRERKAFKYSAHHGALTGLPNRVLFHERLGQILTATALGRGCCAVALLDPDDFKPVNDAFGHETGDLVLQRVAVRLRGRCGKRIWRHDWAATNSRCSCRRPTRPARSPSPGRCGRR